MIQANEALIEAACAGSEQALSHLLIVCQPDLKRFARRTCSTSEDAEDAVQIALWQLYKKVGTLRTVAAFSGWLFRIVERECYRLFRRTYTESISERFDDAVERLTDDELCIDQARSIAELPQAYRIVFILRDIEGWTTPEAAEKLGLSPEAVKSRLHRARAAVRDNLSRSGYRQSSTVLYTNAESGD